MMSDECVNADVPVESRRFKVKGYEECEKELE